MNDKELADRIVALGVGKAHQIYPDALGRFYQIDVEVDWQASINKSKFVRDPRVAMAMMEKCRSFDIDIEEGGATVSAWAATNYPGPSVTKGDDSLPRAINLACVEALKEKES